MVVTDPMQITVLVLELFFQKMVTLLTNTHIISGNKLIKVKLHTGEEIDANLIGADVNADIAVLKINSNSVLKPIKCF